MKLKQASDSADIVSLLTSGLRQLSLSPEDNIIKAFLLYLEELKKWGKAYNLTAMKTDREIVIKHFLDSLLYLGAIPPGSVSLLDVGTGAGFPGIPLRIIRPDVRLHLLEPSWKKANFLRNMVKVLGLKGTTVMEQRVEDIQGLSVDVAVTRALFRVGEFVTKVGHLLNAGGVIVLSKGPKVKDELHGLEPGWVFREDHVVLPFDSCERTIVVVERGGDAGGSEASSVLPHSGNLGVRNICINSECRLRKGGCRGFEGCPGFRSRGE